MSGSIKSKSSFWKTPASMYMLVAVDDGGLPASVRPLSTTFSRYKDPSEANKPARD